MYWSGATSQREPPWDQVFSNRNWIQVIGLSSYITIECFTKRAVQMQSRIIFIARAGAASKCPEGRGQHARVFPWEQVLANKTQVPSDWIIIFHSWNTLPREQYRCGASSFSLLEPEPH
jgi:hypothetical protein